MNGRALPPRNYLPIPVEPDGIVRGGEPQPHDQLRRGPGALTGAAGLEIKVLAPVHVGCGAYGLVDGQVVKEPVRRDGKVVLPGSSIKGMCRQIHEVLTQSASPFSEEPPASARGSSQGPSRSEALFGFLGFQGRVSFDDASSAEALEPQVVHLSVPYSPQNPVGRRFYGAMPEGAEQPPRIPVVAIPAGARLQTVLRFRNVAEDELGGVFLSLGLDRFTPKLGGGKYDPIGWVRFHLRRYRVRSGIGQAETWIEDPAAVERWREDLLGKVSLPPAGQEALELLEARMQAPENEKGGGR
jgi:CRISPR/Cas system CMR subunit Cmr6 (Cas7 group RAMP superfamily)